jgi:thioredoxin 1
MFRAGHLVNLIVQREPGNRYIRNQNGATRVIIPVLQHRIFTTQYFLNMAYEFSDASFKDEVIGSNKVTLVDLWAEWCGPCKMMTPVVEELSAEYEGRAVIGKLNVDDNPEVPTNYNVRGIPTFLIFKNGELKEKIVGAQTKTFLKEKIDSLL